MDKTYVRGIQLFIIIIILIDVVIRHYMIQTMTIIPGNNDSSWLMLMLIAVSTRAIR